MSEALDDPKGFVDKVYPDPADKEAREMMLRVLEKRRDDRLRLGSLDAVRREKAREMKEELERLRRLRRQ